MKFTVADEIFEKYPDAVIGIVAARNLDNAGENEGITALLRKEESKIRDELQLETLSQQPVIQSWRKAYRAFGSDDRASHEALIRRVLKGDSVRHISKLVDIYNFISLKYRTPVGGEDMDKIEGDIFLKFAEGNERFVLLGSAEESHPDAGEIVYADSKEILCRKWNWRESENTKLTESTRNAVLVMEGLPPVSEDIARNAAGELAALAERYCNAGTKTFVLTGRNRQAGL